MIFKISFYFFLLSFTIKHNLLSKELTDKSLEANLKRISQDCNKYISSNQYKSILNEDINIIKLKFINKYSQVWQNFENVYTKKKIKEIIKRRNKKYLKHPGYAANRKPFNINIIKKIIQNIDLNSFFNFQKAAITLRDTNLRELPTLLPSFKNWDDKGNGYPFDQFQDAYLNAFQPIFVLQQSKDKEWSLIIDSHKCCGWIKTDDIAFVSDKFKNNWIKNKFITLIEDKIDIKDIKTNKFITKARIGQIFPLIKENEKEYIICYPKSDINDNAYLSLAKIPKKSCSKFPLKTTQNNFSILINNLIGEPYGWNGYHGFRDCASLLKDLFIPFGMFLPTKSIEQAKEGTFINIKKEISINKYKRIIKEGIPFLTLIRMPGHIFLYIGSKNNIPYVFHSVWGYKTMYKNIEKRAVIGRAIIMPLDLVKSDNDNIYKEWIERVSGIIKLAP